MLDAFNNVTTNPTLATRYNYTVSVRKLIIGFSFSSATVSVINSKSTIVVVPPNNAVSSSAPINGTYTITCNDNNGKSYKTREILYTAGTPTIEQAISLGIPFLFEKTKVYLDYRYLYPENGISFMLDFVGIDYEVPLC